jgi:DNA-binding response OmpR family regulator
MRMARLKGKRILIADDDSVVTRLLESLLKAEGVEVICAHDGLDALAEVQKQIPDLIILDVMMPEINGYDVCYQLKFNKKYEHIPIILLTERNQELDEAIGKRVNIDYLPKPLDFKVLQKKLNNLLTKDQ